MDICEGRHAYALFCVFRVPKACLLEEIPLWQLAAVVLTCHYLAIRTCRTQCHDVATMTFRELLVLAEDVA